MRKQLTRKKAPNDVMKRRKYGRLFTNQWNAAELAGEGILRKDFD